MHFHRLINLKLSSVIILIKNHNLISCTFLPCRTQEHKAVVMVCEIKLLKVFSLTKLKKAVFRPLTLKFTLQQYVPQ